MTNKPRFATFNVSLNRSYSEELIADLSTPDNSQARAVAEIIQRNNPDVLLLNEFDYDSEGEAIELFRKNYLGVSQNGVEPVEYPYVYVAPSNTGILSGFDLDNDGATDGAGDAYGFGSFPGQFGMVLLSKYPIDSENMRTFQTFLWQDMPGALLPDNPETPEPNDYYSEEELAVLRLSSKSHWDIPVEINGEIVHILASHPTPPVFDGEEDRNGQRNHDEIRFWADYITPGSNSYIYDDNGNYGGLGAGEKFVILGDLNADPLDGDSTNNAVSQLLNNPLINTSITPSSDGGVDAANRTGDINLSHLSDPAFDTGDFNDAEPGNLRTDYVLPSQNIAIKDAEVFWTTAEDPLFRLIGDFDPALLPTGYPSSDHRLVSVDASLTPEVTDNNRKTITNLDFLGEATFPTGFTFADTEVGGISSLTYDAANNLFYALSDDCSSVNDARFYTLDIDLSDGSLDEGDIEFSGVTTLLNVEESPFSTSSLDPEGIALTSEGTLFISSEGDADNLVDPFIGEFSLDGQIFDELTIPDKFLPTTDKSSGIQNNQALESLTITPAQKYLFTANENALLQDGESSSLESGSLVRILKYDRATEEVIGEFLYETDAIPVPPNPADGFADNGLVELVAINNTGTLLALERSFAEGVGNNIRLYQVNLQGATDVSGVDGLLNEAGEITDIDAIARKKLLLDFSDLGITLDNSEAVSFGEKLPDGRQTIIVASDNNFSENQSTQFLAFAIDTETIPTITPITETPSEIRFGSAENPDLNNAPDADDPAIYVNPEDSSESFVISTFKNGGLRVYDLEGNETQSITPENIRYNNVDIAYNVPFTGFVLPGSTVDLAIASDRANDTIAVFIINPETKELTKLDQGFEFPESIFGVDDQEATAYGLATYNSLVDGKTYVFVSQAEGNKIAQLEITPTTGAADEPIVNAKVVRMIDVPVPEGKDAEDYQVEGMVVDRETGYLYVGQEEFGIWKYSAEPNDSNEPILVDAVEGGNIEADVEGLTIYYGEDGNGYLLASSQGDNTLAIYDRAGSNSYLGNFAVEGVEESDGADISNVPLGDNYPAGLLVVQDASNTPQVVFPDPEDGEIQNFNTNFKYVSLADFENLFPNLPTYDPSTFDPRNPKARTLINGVASGDTTQDSTVLWARSTVLGNITFEYATDERFVETEGLINDTQLFETGLQAFQEYNPLRNEFYGETEDDVTAGERQLYRYNTYGSDAATFVLDTRSFRDPGLTPPSDITNPEEIERVLTESITLDRTLLGEVQLEDLKQDLIAADEAGVTWKFVMIPEPIQNLFPGINVDSYEGYLKERAELLSFIEENNIENVVFVAADVHMTSVNNLTYQTKPFGEQIATSAWEITTGAIAYDTPTGESLANSFTDGNPELEALYKSLPISPDGDDIPNDKDDFVKQAINDNLLAPLGFDPIGLDKNLPQAEGLIDAQLLQGDYYVGHSYSWTEFDIDADTQQLKVTTYGVDGYSEAEILANPNAINELTPTILSEFVVNPNIDLFL